MLMPVSKSKVQTIHLVCLAVVVVSVATAAQPAAPPATLPPEAVSALHRSIEAARPHARHVWRDTAPQNDDGTVNAYIEISRGDRRKYELSIAANERFVDREMPRELGGYPINYGIVPQTISYDGDPFDALVLGPPLRGGSLVRGVIVGVMHMDDEKGLDSKVILSRVDRRGRALHALRDNDRRRLTDFFNRYKKHEPGKFSKVTGWGDAAAGLAFVRTTHGFFRAAAQ
jgi:inorganic pyrophosphatase